MSLSSTVAHENMVQLLDVFAEGTELIIVVRECVDMLRLRLAECARACSDFGLHKLKRILLKHLHSTVCKVCFDPKQ